MEQRTSLQAYTFGPHARVDTGPREAERAGLDTQPADAAAQPQPQHAHKPSSTAESPLQGLSLAGATAALGSGQSLITDYIMGADASLAQIRVIDPTTHQVVAASPPDTIAQIQQEMLAYQNVARRIGPAEKTHPAE